MIYSRCIASTIGTIEIKCTESNVVGIKLLRQQSLAEQQDSDFPAVMVNCCQALNQYFSGDRQHFNFPLTFSGTSFQQQVWSALLTVAYGQTITYAALASLIGNPRAVRAVGQAVGANHLPIIVPCHRVIGSDGGMTGFAYGLEVKRWLLNHEQVVKRTKPTI
jgi:methylated-DNA-[protein]-cysteine S-methyltransferase